MSPTAITLVAVFGSIGYLLIGWATTVVVAAQTAWSARVNQYETNSPRKVKAPVGAYGALVGWPLVWVGSAVWWLARKSLPTANAVTLRAVQRLNPRVEEWGHWD